MPRPKGPTLNQDDIVKAALLVLRSQGPARFGLNSVARQLGIKPPSMYNHVKGNDDLFRLVALYGWQKFLSYARSALNPEMKGREQLVAIAASYRRCAQDYPELLTIAMSHRMILEDLEFAQLYEGIMQLYTNVLGPWGFDEVQIIHAARMFNSALAGYSQLENNRIFQRSESQDASHEWMILRLVDSLEQLRS
jgi:AcrR family transcriptional regulator